MAHVINHSCSQNFIIDEMELGSETMSLFSRHAESGLRSKLRTTIE